MTARIRLSVAVVAALLVLLTLIRSLPRCQADSAECSSFLRPSIFANVPPTLRLKYILVLARTSPARTFSDVFIKAKAGEGSTKSFAAADSTCPHCSLLKNSLPPWSMGKELAPFKETSVMRILAHTLEDNGFQVMQKPHALGEDNHTRWYGIWGRDHIRRGFLTATYQKFNGLPRLIKMGNKAFLERVARRLYRLFPHFERLRTWILPDEAKAFQTEWKSRWKLRNRGQHWVLKPVLGSLSHGVRVVTQLEQVQDQLKPNSNAKPFHRQHVIQEYVPDPFLIRGRKAELRMYVVVTSTTPLRAYLSTPAAAVVKNGLRPFTMDPGSLSNKCVHTVSRHGCGNTGTHTRMERLSTEDLSKVQFGAIYNRIEGIIAGLLLLMQNQAWTMTKHVLLNRYSGYHPMTFDFFLDKSKQDGNVTVYFNEINSFCAVHSEVEVGHVPIAVLNLVGYHLPPLSSEQSMLLQKCQPALNSSAAVFDKRLYKLELSQAELKKQERVLRALLAAYRNSNVNSSNPNFEFENEMDKIMNDIIQPDELTSDDVRYLITLINEEVRTESYFLQLLPLRIRTASSDPWLTRPQEWKDVYSRMKYYAKVLLDDWKPTTNAPALGTAPINAPATSALYYYALYEAYTRKHGQDLRLLKELAESGFHLQ